MSKFTLRCNGQIMTTLRIPVSISQDEWHDLNSKAKALGYKNLRDYLGAYLADYWIDIHERYNTESEEA